jgi:hypothetical protein
VIVGELRIEPGPFGFGEIGMMVAADWRGRGDGERGDLVETGLLL